MDLRGRHHRHEDDKDWQLRRGRYEGLAPDEPGSPAVKPGEAPAPDEQTHTRRGSRGAAEAAYRDGGDE